MILGLAASIATNSGELGIASVGSGAGLIVKGMEEFMGGKTSAAVSDVIAGVSEIKTSLPEAKKEAVTIESNPIPVAVEAAKEVAAKVDEQKVA
jgi:hypothetical protein